MNRKPRTALAWERSNSGNVVPLPPSNASFATRTTATSESRTATFPGVVGRSGLRLVPEPSPSPEPSSGRRWNSYTCSDCPRAGTILHDLIGCAFCPYAK